MNLALSEIRTDGGTQPRGKLDRAVVGEYAELMRDGKRFPPVNVVFDGTDYWLYDGFHRREAAVSAGLDSIECEVKQGTLQTAQWLSYAANQDHGQRRTDGDKKRAIEAALAHPNAERMSARDIAAHVGVSHTWVARVRERASVHSVQIPAQATAEGQEAEEQEPEMREVTRAGKKYEMNVGNIGAKQKKANPAGSSKGVVRAKSKRLDMLVSAHMSRFGHAIGAADAALEAFRTIEMSYLAGGYSCEELKGLVKKLRYLADGLKGMASAVERTMYEKHKAGERGDEEDSSGIAADTPTRTEGASALTVN